MKKIAVVLTALMLSANVAHAQPAGGGSSAGSNASFSWGLGLAGLAVVGVVAGVSAAAASSNNTFSSH